MFNTCLLSLAFFGGTLVGPYRIAQAEPGHHQVRLQAAMAADGRFAIAWIDSLQFSDHFELDLYIRFFDKDGNPLSNTYRIPKLLDTVWINHPSLSMDSSGNTILAWVEGRTLSNTKLSKIRFQYFTPDAVPAGSPKTLYSDVDIGYATPVNLANNGVFALAFSTRLGGKYGVWVQRFNLDGIPQDSAFITHDTLPHVPPYETFRYPRISLNDAGDVVVSWLDCIETAHMYPRFQAFDKDDKPILPWESKGHRIDDSDSLAGACRPDPCWIDNDRFIVFWTDYCIQSYPLVGRVFSQKGAVKHSIRLLMSDSLWGNEADPRGRFYTAVLSDGRFAETHTRFYSYIPEISQSVIPATWEHAGGIFGQVVNNEPWRRTAIFEYSAPFGTDTLFTTWGFPLKAQFDSPPAVAACNDRLIWVYPRFNSDTIFEAWAVISDWDMGVPSSETPASVTRQFEITNSVGREIVLRFWDRPEGFAASIFDASGRKVDEIYSTQTQGIIQWGGGRGPGVYFIVPDGSKGNPLKVVLVR